MVDLGEIRQRFLRLRPFLDERHCRLWAANESLAGGRGGLKWVAAATGLARSTLIAGRNELRTAAGGAGIAAAAPGSHGRVRRPGAGRKRRTEAASLWITADGGGSNGSRLHLWKVALQAWADETGLALTVCHFPPGTSKWNKSAQRMFSEITKNWRGRPLQSHEVIVELIEHTRTGGGLTIRAELDEAPMKRARRSPPPIWPG